MAEQLSTQQRQSIYYLAQGMSAAEVAKKLSLEEAIISDWLENNLAFNAELERRQQKSVEFEQQFSQDSLENENNLVEIAGSGHRFLAFAIDGFIIAIPLIIAGFIFRDIAFSLGPWGRIIGYGIIFGYWAYCNSELGSGQTIGKKIIKIVVVDGEGSYLPVSKSLLRAFVLALIGLINQWALPIFQNPIVRVIAATIIFGGGLAIAYGLIFNRKTRQGLHDLIAASYVVKALPNSQAEVPLIPMMHKRITYGIVGIGFAVGVAGLILQETPQRLGILEPKEWEEIQQLQTILLGNDDFFSVGVQRINRNQLGQTEVLRDLNIGLWAKKSCGRNREYCQELVNEVARTAFAEYDGIEELSGMRITIINQFDLGLANGHFTMGAERRIEDWHKSLD